MVINRNGQTMIHHLNMSKIFLGLFFLSLFGCGHKPSTTQCNYPIYWHEVGLYPKFETVPTVDTLDVILSKGYKMIMKVMSCTGRATFQKVDPEGNVILKGAYSDSMGLLGKHRRIFDVTSETDTVYLLQFYEGLKHGTWEFFSEGKLYKVENYHNGRLLDSLTLK